MFWEWLWPALTAAGFALIGFFAHALVVRMRDAAANRAAGDLLREARRDADMLRKEAERPARDEWIPRPGADGTGDAGAPAGAVGRRRPAVEAG